jgi:hypothetical protein
VSLKVTLHREKQYRPPVRRLHQWSKLHRPNLYRWPFGLQGIGIGALTNSFGSLVHGEFHHQLALRGDKVRGDLRAGSPF